LKSKRRFELKNQPPTRFCEIWVSDKVIYGSYGKVGDSGIPYMKNCLTSEGAQKEYETKINGFLKKGYEEVAAVDEPQPLLAPETKRVEDVVLFPDISPARLEELEKHYFHGASLDDALQDRFKFDSFRANQREAIHQLLEHQRLLCIMPTGRGKSLLFQLPASLLPGLTVVLSPLKALMRDQIQGLRERFRISAETLNSDQTVDERKEVKARLRAGGVKLLYLAPEQISKPDIQSLLAGLKVDMLGVDEAHCISTWGHDFRPAYREMNGVVDALYRKNPKLLVLCITATANKKVADDIARQFGIENKGPIHILRDSADRPNLSLKVVQAKGRENKLEALGRLLAEKGGPAIVYCAKRKSAETVAEYLSALGHKAVGYHGGLETSVKHRIQAEFQNNVLDVVAATNSLGMGIDKGDIRQVIHFEFPGNLTNYYQEIGRAGRDGQISHCTLIYDPKDIKTQEFFLENAKPTPQEVENVLRTVKESSDNDAEPVTAQVIMAHARLDKEKTGRILVDLVQQGLLEKKIHGWEWGYVPTDKNGTPDYERYERLYEKGLAELRDMMAYAEMRKGCHMQVLRKKLGDEAPEKCGHCWACVHGGAAWTGEEKTGCVQFPKKRNTRWGLTKRKSPRALFPKNGTSWAGEPDSPKEKAYDVEQIRKTFAKAYAGWSQEEEEQLKGFYGREMSLKVIAEKLGRKPGAIRMRLRKLGLEE
jgi:RecQ family ATP-dependent DNA helicase